jgi:histidinol phosphatase-like PHP family hydrolase
MDLRLAEIRGETDILADGTLDYPDDLLKELYYTVCSVHSRFALGKQAKTKRILRAMDSRARLGNQAGVKIAVSTVD